MAWNGRQRPTVAQLQMPQALKATIGGQMGLMLLRIIIQWCFRKWVQNLANKSSDFHGKSMDIMESQWKINRFQCDFPLIEMKCPCITISRLSRRTPYIPQWLLQGFFHRWGEFIVAPCGTGFMSLSAQNTTAEHTHVQDFFYS